MITVYTGEQRNGRMKYTSDRDCLSPDITRFNVRYFPSDAEVFEEALKLERRGWRVCIDLGGNSRFYETE